MADLYPCPFCASVASKMFDKNNKKWSVMCNNRDTTVMSKQNQSKKNIYVAIPNCRAKLGPFREEQEAEEAWNRRKFF